MTAERKLMRALAEQQADDRAHRIATRFAEDLVRSNGTPTGAPDEYLVPFEMLDDEMFDCIMHLAWHGEAAYSKLDDESYVVLFGDFTIGGPD